MPGFGATQQLHGRESLGRGRRVLLHGQRQGEGIFHGLAAALAHVGRGGVRGIANQADAAPVPIRQRVEIHDFVFDDGRLIGRRQNGRHGIGKAPKSCLQPRQ